MLSYINKNMNGEHELNGEAKLFTERMIFLYQKIDKNLANDIHDKILLLNKLGDQPIDLIINSGGGDIKYGLLILDAIKGSSAPIRTICTSEAYSMAAIIFSAGAKRYMYPHAQLLLHEPHVGKIDSADITSLTAMAEEMMNYKHESDLLLAEYTGRTLEEIEKVTDTVTVFNAEEAISFGLCDEIIAVKDLAGGLK